MNPDFSLNSAISKWLIVGLVVRFVTAVFSEGYIHPDEYFQVFEFLKKLRGDGIEVPWEWGAQIRPLMQVTIFRLLLWPLESVLSPIDQILAVKIFMAVLSFVGIRFFLKAANESQVFTIRILEAIAKYWALFGLLPFFSIRTSSEALAMTGLCFVWGLGFLAQKHQRVFDYSLLGLSVALLFFIRFQVAFGFVGVALIFCFKGRLFGISRKFFRHYVALFFGFIFGFLTCVCLDSYLYGSWVFTPFNYFYANIIEGVAAQFGTSPSYYYFQTFLTQWFPLSLVFCLAWFLSVGQRPLLVTNIFCFSFVLGHSLVGHKEFRFIIPVFAFAPIFLAFLFEKISNRWIGARRVFWILNTFYLIFFGFFPLRTEFTFYRNSLAVLPKGATVFYKTGEKVPFTAHGHRLEFLLDSSWILRAHDGDLEQESFRNFLSQGHPSVDEFWLFSQVELDLALVDPNLVLAESGSAQVDSNLVPEESDSAQVDSNSLPEESGSAQLGPGSAKLEFGLANKTEDVSTIVRCSPSITDLPAPLPLLLDKFPSAATRLKVPRNYLYRCRILPRK